MEHTRAEAVPVRSPRPGTGDPERLRHDLQAPLAAITGFSELLRWESAGTLNDRQQRYVECILEAAARLRQLLDEALPPGGA